MSLCTAEVLAQSSQELQNDIDRLARQVELQVIHWRRDFHQYPELGNREFRTAKIIAKYLTQLGMEVQTNIAHTGVVGILRGQQAEPVVALRADMDALPVTEQVDLPFASKVRTIYNGREVGVMHACGHDAHMAILMGVAHILTQVRYQLPGTVKFIFQPAEEGAPAGEEGGAALMVKEGVLENPAPSAIFGLHVIPGSLGSIGYKPGGIMAAADGLHITVHGRQTHGAAPWGGVDPIVVSAQIIMALQTVTSRQLNITTAPAVVTIGTIQGGVRSNIIPDEVEMTGTIRTLDPDMRRDVHQRIQRTIINIAESAGATTDIEINMGVPVTYNDPELTKQMAPTLERAAGKQNVSIIPATTGAEDFSVYQEQIPGLYFFLGITPVNEDYRKAPQNHSPLFYVDESALIVGVRTLSNLAADYLYMHSNIH
ncbi:MAG: N-acyl-L-amino acid amidohydrolase [Phycisphaerae bacterium SM23_30]|nr:MAG: N-acyl-L-amino acid amidohydrolase [Phycisphaerae bacterium SM23_30]